MPTLLISVLAGGIVGWLCHGRVWRALSLSVPASAACFGVMWCLRSEPQEVEAQWLASQPGFWIFVYIVFCLLPCAVGAAITTALSRQARNRGRKLTP